MNEIMNVSALTASPAQIPEAIARAAASTGIDFAFLLQQARAESGLNPAAHARSSSASGLFQFIDSTWLAVIKQHGAAHGLGWAAAAIERAGHQLHIADPAMRQAVLALRLDPQISSTMAAAHTADNKAGLEARLGRVVGAADLALAHFLGLGGATKFLRALVRDPAASAVGTVPQAAPGNHRIFYDRGGAARSLTEVYEHIAARFAGTARPALAPTPEPAQYPQGAAFPAPAYARAAYLMLAELGA
jgi:hypothetical protein